MGTTDDLRAIRKHLATGGLAGQVRRLVDVLIAERNDTDDRHPYGVCGDRAASVAGAPLVCTLDPGHEGAHFDVTSTAMWGVYDGAGKGSTAARTGARSDAQPAEAPGEARSEIGPQNGVQSLGDDLRTMARGEHPDQSCRPHPKFTEAFMRYADRADALEADRSTLAEVNHEAETIILVETMRAEKAEAERDEARAEAESLQRAAQVTDASWREHVERAKRAEAAVARVRKIHRHRTSRDGRTDWCESCEDGPWPCATVTALDGVDAGGEA